MGSILVQTNQGMFKSKPMNCAFFNWTADIHTIINRAIDNNGSTTIFSGPIMFFQSAWRFKTINTRAVEVMGNGYCKVFMRLQFLPDELDDWRRKGLKMQTHIELSVESKLPPWNDKYVMRGDMGGFGLIDFFVVVPVHQSLRNERETIKVKWVIFMDEQKPDISVGYKKEVQGELHYKMIDFYTRTDSFKDLKIICNSTEFMVHKSVMAANSSVFERILKTELNPEANAVIEITQKTFDGKGIVSPIIVDTMLKWIYARLYPHESLHGWLELIMLSHKYELRELKAICVVEISNRFSKDVIIPVIIMAETIEAVDLKTNAIDYFLRNAEIKKELISNREYAKLSNSLKTDIMLAV